MLNIGGIIFFDFDFLLVHIQELPGDIPNGIPCSEESNKQDSKEDFKDIGEFLNHRVGIDEG